tara:strand:+ start:20 stop:220 length:201 start_codon:yes stop_codon:yes gene_type:complete
MMGKLQKELDDLKRLSTVLQKQVQDNLDFSTQTQKELQKEMSIHVSKFESDIDTSILSWFKKMLGI